MATIMDEYDDGDASLEYQFSSKIARQKVWFQKSLKKRFQGAIFEIMSSKEITKLATHIRRPSRTNKAALGANRRDPVARNIPKDTAAFDE